MGQTSFVFDASTEQVIEELKREFGVTTKVAVIRRALALARVAARSAAEDHTVTILDKDKQPQKVFLKG